MEFNKVYSFIISPSDEVIAKIKGLKALCNQLIGNFKAEHSKAHITVSVPYPENPGVMVNRCRRWMQDLAYVPSYIISINNFGYFENSSGYVIYAKIALDDFANNWFRSLKTNFDNEKSFMPHITIARNLTQNQFAELWPYFNAMPYQKSFQVDSVLILENEIVKTGPDQVFKKIALGPPNILPRLPWTLFDNV